MIFLRTCWQASQEPSRGLPQVLCNFAKVCWQLYLVVVVLCCPGGHIREIITLVMWPLRQYWDSLQPNTKHCLSWHPNTFLEKKTRHASNVLQCCTLRGHQQFSAIWMFACKTFNVSTSLESSFKKGWWHTSLQFGKYCTSSSNIAYMSAIQVVLNIILHLFLFPFTFEI